MIERIWRNRGPWLRLIIQNNPVVATGSISTAINNNARKHEKELRSIREKIKKYEEEGCKAEKLTDTI